MKFWWLRSPLFWSIALLALLYGVYQMNQPDSGKLPSHPLWFTLPEQSPELGWFIKPFMSPEGESAVALDGGEFPLLTYSYPELHLGKNREQQPVHLALLVDLHSRESRRLLRELFHAYDSPPASLPDVRIIILPISSSSESKGVHERVVRAYLMTSLVETFPNLIRSICATQDPPDPKAIDAFLADNEPDLYGRMGTAGHVVDEKIEKVFEAAALQQQRNQTLLQRDAMPQCVAMNLALLKVSDSRDWAAFIKTAQTFQNNFLASETGKTPITPAFGCHCTIPSHRHEPWKVAVIKRFPGYYPAPDRERMPSDAAMELPTQ